jgi:hypothetical protein
MRCEPVVTLAALTVVNWWLLYSDVGYYARIDDLCLYAASAACLACQQSVLARRQQKSYPHIIYYILRGPPVAGTWSCGIAALQKYKLPPRHVAVSWWSFAFYARA